jgi:cation transport ATPase
VQSALESVKGVKEVSVSLENKEAVVKYDPDVAKVEELIKAVKDARGMNSYTAKDKEKVMPDSAVYGGAGKLQFQSDPTNFARYLAPLQ